MKPIYLDHNATTPILDEVAEAMIPFLKNNFGNPSSSHYYGVQTKRAIALARQQVADLLGCLPEEIVFTSGGTESNNFAIRGVAESFHHKGHHIITSQIEHPAVKNVCKYLEGKGYDVTYLPVDEYGKVNPEDVEKAIRKDTILITIMHANNEVGTIQPIAEIAKIAKKHNVLLHTDAAQSVGKIPTRVDELGVDLLSVAGHKLYAPKGVGALFIRKGIRLQPLIIGADHESGLRAGTENVLEIVGLGKACEIARRDLDDIQKKYKSLSERLWTGLKREIPDIQLNGHPEQRLPNTLSVSFPGIDANTLLDELSDIAASAGAACHTDVAEPSAVLVAMNVPLDRALGTIRFSVGRLNDEDQIDRAVRSIVSAIHRLKPKTSAEPSSSIPLSDVKLTHFTHGLGCACKLRPQNLEKILASMPQPRDSRILVGTNTADDAAVYQISENMAIVQTVDFFTPIVDNPYDFGAISAANSMSDIYAMGGKPLFALNIVGFPEKRLPLDVLSEILRGASDKAKEAGIPIIGGHTVEDNEPKFGLAVTGIIDPKEILTNSNAQSGDAIVLTKPIGLGIITTAIKRGLADENVKKEAIAIMAQLNNKAAEQMKQFHANSCTDVTGFGLLGHLREMSMSSKMNCQIYLSKVQMLKAAREYALMDVIPGGTKANLEFVSKHVDWDNKITEIDKFLLCDAQTSGGLLISMPQNEAEKFMARLSELGIRYCSIIGKFTEKGAGKISVLP